MLETLTVLGLSTLGGELLANVAGNVLDRTLCSLAGDIKHRLSRVNQDYQPRCRKSRPNRSIQAVKRRRVEDYKLIFSPQLVKDLA